MDGTDINRYVRVSAPNLNFLAGVRGDLYGPWAIR